MLSNHQVILMHCQALGGPFSGSHECPGEREGRLVLLQGEEVRNRERQTEVDLSLGLGA